MTSAIQLASQAKKRAAVEAINRWFIQKHYTDTGIGAMVLDSIFQRIMKLPEVEAYVNDDGATAAKKTRFWTVQTTIVTHLQYYILGRDLPNV